MFSGNSCIGNIPVITEKEYTLNKLKIAVSLAAVLAVSPMAFANPIINQLNSATAGFQGNFLNYQEHVPAAYGPSDTETGFAPGLALGVSGTTKLFGVPLYGAVSYSQSAANLNYKWGNVRDLDSARFYTAEAKLGTPIFFGRDIALVPYVDGGYRHWNRNLQGPAGYQEVYSNKFAGIGAQAYYAFNRRFVVGADVSVNDIIGGGLDAYNYGGPLGTASVSFGNSLAESVGFSASYRLNPALGLYADVGYSHLRYAGGNSNIPGVIEPASTTNQVNVGIGARFYF